MGVFIPRVRGLGGGVDDCITLDSMIHVRAHPIALVTMASACWVAAAVWNVHAGHRLAAVIVIAILGSPLAILLWAHLRRARSWLHDVWLAFCGLLVAFACVFALFLVTWFHLGSSGLLFFASVLSVVATGCALLVPRKETVPDAV